jgi:hypothetical protein
MLYRRPTCMYGIMKNVTVEEILQEKARKEMFLYIIVMTLTTIGLCGAVRLHLFLGLHRITKTRTKKEIGYRPLWWELRRSGLV